MLVENADLFLKNRENAVVYDLCSGSGCIGITVKNRNPSLDVYLMEKYPAALSYLRKNARLYNFTNENIIECDVLSGCPDLPKADLIISNRRNFPLCKGRSDLSRKRLSTAAKTGLCFTEPYVTDGCRAAKKAGRCFWNAVTRRARTSELFLTVRLHRRKLCTILIILTG